MKFFLRVGFIAMMSLAGVSLVGAAAVDDLLAQYRTQSGGTFNIEEGKAAWNRLIPDSKTGEERSCAGCHGSDLRRTGKHLQTGKPIDPMAPSVNAKRLTDPKFVEKWFKRNCQWTLGRECSPKEKGMFLTFIQNQ